jgi:hypothetical protein
MARLIEVTGLALRDAHQSLLATRMAIEDMVPVCEDLDNAGYWSLECWGGATYDACIRFLNEDPWERLRTFRKLLPKSRLQNAAARAEPPRLPPPFRFGIRPLFSIPHPRTPSDSLTPACPHPVRCPHGVNECYGSSPARS